MLKKYFNIGFAADTPNGLVVPVIKDVGQEKRSCEIARETGELAAKARDGKLSPTEMQGGCFSISSLGGIGGTFVHADHQRARGRHPWRLAGRRQSPCGTARNLRHE